MPDLVLRIVGVDVPPQAVIPLLRFKLQVTAPPDSPGIHGLLLNTQIQLACPQRSYSPVEQEKLRDLFGKPADWGRTLRNRLWTHAHAAVGPFCGQTEVVLPVPCTFDLEVASAKYFYGLEGGEVPLLFLFSGSVFYEGAGQRLQAERISWDQECTYRLPVSVWRELMQAQFPDRAWLQLPRDVFDRLLAYKRRQGLAGWEQTMDALLSEAGRGAAASLQLSGQRSESGQITDEMPA